MEWIAANGQEIFNIVMAIIGVAKLGAKLTPSEVDDNYVGKAIKMLDVIGLVGTKTQIKVSGKF